MWVTCFKAYDVRGKVPGELNEELAYNIGRAYAAVVKPKHVAVGRDVRPSGRELAAALCRGLNDAGVDVLDIGICGTELVYFATFHLGLDGGIMVTASHNPPEYNGMKFVREQGIPISGESGLREIEARAVAGDYGSSLTTGRTLAADPTPDYIEHVLEQIDLPKLRPLHIACNAGNGCAGPVLDLLEARLPFRFTKTQHEPDGSFPNGVPNPLLPEKRDVTADLVRASGADLGVAWDGDFDRCFFFDEKGSFVEGYYLVGLLAEASLKKHPGSKIIHDPRLTWNTVEVVEGFGGVPVLSKTGHAFIKERMRAEDAEYGGEMSAHHYFKTFSYCDSGMLPWLLVAEILSERNQPFSALLGERKARYPVSGEINREVGDADAILTEMERRYGADGRIDHTDGLSVEFDTWRFNVRKSNTEPLLRLNVETRGDAQLLTAKTDELLALIDARSASPHASPS